MTVVQLHPAKPAPPQPGRNRLLDMGSWADIAQSAQIAAWFAFTVVVFAKVLTGAF